MLQLKILPLQWNLPILLRFHWLKDYFVRWHKGITRLQHHLAYCFAQMSSNCLQLPLWVQDFQISNHFYLQTMWLYAWKMIEITDNDFWSIHLFKLISFWLINIKMCEGIIMKFLNLLVIAINRMFATCALKIL